MIGAIVSFKTQPPSPTQPPTCGTTSERLSIHWTKPWARPTKWQDQDQDVDEDRDFDQDPNQI